MYRIDVGHLSTSNALLVYNPQTKKFYEPDSYWLDLYCLPSSVYSSVTYDGDIFCSFHWDNTPVMKEPSPPDTRVGGTYRQPKVTR